MVDTVDISAHGTNAGSGTYAGNTSYSPIGRLLALNFSSTGNQVNINVGAEPLGVDVINETDTIFWKWHRGMAATKVLKITGVPAVTIDTGSAIVVTKLAEGAWQISLSATLAAASKVLTLQARF